MIIIYFIIGCIALGLLNYFVVFPLTEKEIIKRIAKKIKDICLDLFIVYSIIIIFIGTLNILISWLHSELAGFLAFGIVGIFSYGYYERNKAKEEKIEQVVRLCRSIYTLDYSGLKNIKEILVDSNGTCVAVIKGKNIDRLKTLNKENIPYNQEALIELDRMYGQEK